MLKGIKPIGLSFKNTPEDMELYKWIISHSNLSGFIKDILREVKESNSKRDNKTAEKEVIEKEVIENVIEEPKLLDLGF
jgi:hypothetical protein